MVTEDKAEDHGTRGDSNEANDDKKNDSSHTNGTTIFVRNLPFEIRDDQLEKEFSEIGPIKRAFVVKDKGEKINCFGFFFSPKTIILSKGGITFMNYNLHQEDNKK